MQLKAFIKIHGHIHLSLVHFNFSLLHPPFIYFLVQFFTNCVVLIFDFIFIFFSCKEIKAFDCTMYVYIDRQTCDSFDTFYIYQLTGNDENKKKSISDLFVIITNHTNNPRAINYSFWLYVFKMFITFLLNKKKLICFAFHFASTYVMKFFFSLWGKFNICALKRNDKSVSFYFHFFWMNDILILLKKKKKSQAGQSADGNYAYKNCWWENVHRLEIYLMRKNE